MRIRILAAAFVLSLFSSPTQAQTPVTFDKEIVRIFQQHCQTCHRPENIAPFSLLTYGEARPWARAIKEAVLRKEMPPWKPVGSHDVFEGERTLTDDQIQTIVNWVDSGSPEGDPSELPEPINFPESWNGGTPDLALQPDEPFALVAADRDVYRCFTMPTNFQTDMWVRGYEVLPGNRSIVHHVLLFTDTSGASVPLDEADPGSGWNCFGGPGFFKGLGGLGGWAPGAPPQMFPAGTGASIPAGARLVIQVHYSVSRLPKDGGPVEPDLTRIGLYLSSTPLQLISILPIISTRFVIPAGDSDYPVIAIMPVLNTVDVYSIAPHMHLLGKKVTVDAWLPFLQRRQMIRIDDWNFHWQGIYNYKKPVRLPAGTILVMTAYYDNSPNNPYNPSNPPVSVRFGEQTTDEMCITFLLVKATGTGGGGGGSPLGGSGGGGVGGGVPLGGGTGGSGGTGGQPLGGR
jgi:Copper type II ascorbate-dependent monooxygenase, C-terminal domain